MLRLYGLMMFGLLSAQEARSIKLNPPDLTRGLPFMQTLAVKASATEWSDKEISLQDLSDLLWAANGLNRPAENKTTASSAMNAHDVDIFVFMKDGVYVYDFQNHELDWVRDGDFRGQIYRPRPRPITNAAEPAEPTPQVTDAPIQLLLISDTDRFRAGSKEARYEWAALDAGIISQNISLFCAATGLKTRPRALVDKDRVREILNLKESQYVFLNHPIGYAK
ncbi:MAG: SagB/ThcOx family dehydrogenase [candidate division KSB1 bacterium]|nr:SagB/ThcOx family dehydrogenase [candidate division KSB1 bacterium]